METKYRLKKTAYAFVNQNLWNKSFTKAEWNDLNISENALEEISAYIYVHVGITENYFPSEGVGTFLKCKTHISNWSIDKGGKLFFTAHLKNVSFSIFQKFENEENRKKLCEALEQKALEIVNKIVNDLNPHSNEQ